MILPSAYAQVLGLGVLWTSIHCIGMCGPLLSGFDIAGVLRGRSRLRGVLGVLSYQAGRALTYAWLGGLAGLVGAGLAKITTLAASVLALLGGIFLCGYALRQLAEPSQPLTLLKLRASRDAETPIITRVLTYSRRALLPVLASQHPLRELALGALMGLLPCMIPAWVLSQAALTESPFHGALVMMLLVVLTTPILLVSTQLPRLFAIFPSSVRTLLPRLLPAVSGLWLILLGGAGLSLWSHVHVGFSLLGKPLMMMLF